MKFAKVLSEAEETFPRGYSGSFIPYRGYKKLLKRQSKKRRSWTSGRLSDDLDFFTELSRSINAIDRTFRASATAVLELSKKFQTGALANPFSALRGYHKLRIGSETHIVPTHGTQGPDELARHAALCLKHAEVNTVALRKLTKKYDKVTQSTRGKAFLEHVWNNHTDRLTFLHSPLQAELSAICLRHPTAAAAAAAPPAPPPLDVSRVQCAVCLDVLHAPIGLSCGHTFCEDCLRCAFRMEGLQAPTSSFISMASRAGAACPQCRDAQCMRDARPLRELEALVKQQFPEEWRQRRADVKQEQRRRIADLSARARKYAAAVEANGGTLHAARFHPSQLLL